MNVQRLRLEGVARGRCRLGGHGRDALATAGWVPAWPLPLPGALSLSPPPFGQCGHGAPTPVPTASPAAAGDCRWPRMAECPCRGTGLVLGNRDRSGSWLRGLRRDRASHPLQGLAPGAFHPGSETSLPGLRREPVSARSPGRAATAAPVTALLSRGMGSGAGAGAGAGIVGGGVPGFTSAAASSMRGGAGAAPLPSGALRDGASTEGSGTSPSPAVELHRFHGRQGRGISRGGRGRWCDEQDCPAAARPLASWVFTQAARAQAWQVGPLDDEARDRRSAGMVPEPGAGYVGLGDGRANGGTRGLGIRHGGLRIARRGWGVDPCLAPGLRNRQSEPSCRAFPCPAGGSSHRQGSLPKAPTPCRPEDSGRASSAPWIRSRGSRAPGRPGPTEPGNRPRTLRTAPPAPWGSHRRRHQGRSAAFSPCSCPSSSGSSGSSSSRFPVRGGNGASPPLADRGMGSE